MNPHTRLSITVSRTADGLRDYLQILSEDGWSLNIVLIADRIEIKDARKTTKAKGGKKA